MQDDSVPALSRYTTYSTMDFLCTSLECGLLKKTYIYISMYVYMCAYMLKHIYIYIYTHIQRNLIFLIENVIGKFI